MPCDLGYKSYSRVDVPAPQPLVLKKKYAAPSVDAALMALIGQDDPAFVEWMNELDATPLLQTALERALAQTAGASGVSFGVNAAGLTASTTYKNDAEKRRAEKNIERVGRRWQIEVLAIVAQLLDFETQVSADGDVLTLEGEKRGSNAVHEYLRVTLDPVNGTTMLFEHFASKQEEALARAKFLALAQRLGVRIAVASVKESGSPIPAGAVHQHFITHKH